jgi:hypothetical protein
MIYTAQCEVCKRVVAYSKHPSAVEEWLNKGLIVSKRDFDNENQKKEFECQFCKSDG